MDADLHDWSERFRSRSAAFLHDLLTVPAAWLLAFWIGFDLGSIPEDALVMALWTLPLAMLVSGITFWSFGLYRGVWRFASIPDFERIAKAAVVATLSLVALLFAITRLQQIPRSTPLVFLLLELLWLAGPRIAYRWIKDRRLPVREETRVLIVGASAVGETLVRQMLQNRDRGYLPVAFVDDTPRRHGAVIRGVPVKGTTTRIPAVVSEYAIDLILLALPDASSEDMQRLVTLCEQTSKPFRTIPHFQSLLNGQAALSQLRPVCIDDLLGRDPVTLNWLAIRRGLAKRVVLVTGAGGSIGSELCRQLVSAEPARLIMVDHSEFNLYQLEREFVARYPDFEFSAQLLDVTDRAGVEALFQRERPQTIFHAAAYKHVPLLQDQVRGAVRNNVLGTQIVTDCADRFGSERFVLISTDKAVNPVNIMGATKRVAELLCQQRSKQSKTDYVTVRFGNVLGSAGSVVPLFQKQIEQGGPVTVTHPEIERYFMTIPEACQLIMQASVMGQHSEIFVLDMGRPIKIRQLAEQMIRLAGLEPGRDIEVQYVGLRPGEKQSEELFYDNEDMLATSHAKIQMARQNADDWDQALEAACAMLDDRDRFALLGSLGDLVPDLATISKHAPTLRALKGEAQVVPLPGRFN